MREHPGDLVSGSVLLYWLPLGAGGRSVRWNGRVFEALVARLERRPPRDLYHSALEVHLGPHRYVIEMAPAWNTRSPERGVVSEGSVGLAWLGRSILFRYEVRRWLDGVIPDIHEAVMSPQPVGLDPVRARQLLGLVDQVPSLTWGRDQLGTGEMWNSNSMVSWLLARTGHEIDAIHPPTDGRAPGWDAGVILARRPSLLMQADVART